MSRTLTGWLFVATQAVLLIALLLLPSANNWPSPLPVQAVGYAAIVAGLAVIVLASFRLGPALTPTPVPTNSGQLATDGFYRYVRHPIYTGVLLIVAGITLRSGSVVTLAVAVLTVVFFTTKAKWEEARLVERYDGYSAYAAVTPRFIPRPPRASKIG